MLALPAETAAAGFWPSELSLLLCWLFTFTTSLVTLEASWFLGQNKEDFPEGAGFLSIARVMLGPGGEIVTGSLFWFLLTSIIVAYTSKGGQLVSAAVGHGVSAAAGSTLFMAFFGTLAVFGTGVTERINRALVAGAPRVYASSLCARTRRVSSIPVRRCSHGPCFTVLHTSRASLPHTRHRPRCILHCFIGAGAPKRAGSTA